ncbi:hypothetical protein OsI_36960 [Oryza sativa Indica Group]|uniref:Uncharacterized protein n=1 Tax=Oryza sativa subsp. indica TaxID=39946 RepID=B8BIG7_ORYSI|nr:hypothetical protein OsI_36960 [Oryza sativa Indica Group]
MERRASRQHRGRPPPASRSGTGRHGSGRPMAGSAALGGKLGLRAASSVWLAAGPSTRRPVGGVVGVVGGGPEEASAWTRFWRRHAGCWRPQPAEAEVEDAGAVGVWETRWLDPPPLPRLSVTAALVAAVYIVINFWRKLFGRYLIIIEDLWATSTWDIIKHALPDANSCSRILTTTEFEDLALQSCSYDSEYIFKMKPLGEDDSRNLFFSTVFGSRSSCPEKLSEVSHDIVRKCGGLPLAVVTIASLLSSQLEKQERWNYINKSLGYSLMTNPNLEGMKQLLNFCYNNLPQHLKACILCLSMYQEGNIIWKDDLVNQWIAEGFIFAIEGHVKEEISRVYFDELVGRNIIQPVHINNNGEVLSCVVHHMVLNFITCKSMEENFMVAIDHSQAATRCADKVRRLSMHFGNIEDATPPTNIRLSQVRTLAFWGVLKCMSFITGFQLLKVLTLHFWGDEDSISSFDLTRISELVQLRYLKVTSNVTLKLPTKMQGLQYLETLKVDGNIDGVPSDIIHLPGLLHLSLPAKTNLPSGIVHMTSLRTLGYFDLSCNSAENLLSLAELTNLRDVQLTYSAAHSDDLKNNMQCLGSILEKLSNLKSITLAQPGSSYANTLHVDSATT